MSKIEFIKECAGDRAIILIHHKFNFRDDSEMSTTAILASDIRWITNFASYIGGFRDSCFVGFNIPNDGTCIETIAVVNFRENILFSLFTSIEHLSIVPQAYPLLDDSSIYCKDKKDFRELVQALKTFSVESGLY